MDPHPDARLQASLARYGRVAVAVALAVAVTDWVGWASGVEPLTRINPSWPQMTPWTALWLAALAAAVAAQSGRPSRARVWAGRGLAAAVGVLAAAVLAEYATARSFGLDDVWFTAAVRMLQSSWPGRPSPQTAWAVLLVAAAVGMMRLDRGTSAAWKLCVAAGGAIAFVSVVAYLFDAVSLVGVTPSTGQSISTALTLVLVVTAAVAARPDRFPLAWLLARPDRRSLVRLMGILAGFPVVVALSRAAFLAAGLGAHAEWTLSIVMGTMIVGAVTFYLSQREQRVLIEKEQVSKQRADAEARYRLLADNAVDIIVHLRGSKIGWISPSVEAALGGPPRQWVGTDLSRCIHPDDMDTVVAVLGGTAVGDSVLRRFRVRSTDGDYHWIDSHAKPYVDADGNADGMIAALRIVDDRVEAEQRLERLARFDNLTGLANRAEAIDRLESALQQSPTLGAQLGILYCDVDRFKDINDTWGHVVGDAVLTTLAARICECVREGDTVGRTGGDEILVLLPGIESIDAAAQIAEKIRSRAAEPIQESGCTIVATLSIGVTIAVPGEAVTSITARADAAMYQAKSAEGNAVIRI
ncbi:diguanylate cyclase domain-containing protein [Mycobacterium servetii]|uniref:Diguanylate cyclase n=1 Tax=Mycobacterium servetii TaxID=3237418 RepID=A0ABV4C4Y2_9MYCO